MQHRYPLAALGFLGACLWLGTARAAYEDLSAVPDNDTIYGAQDIGTFPASIIDVYGVRGAAEFLGQSVDDNDLADFYRFTVSGPAQTLVLTVTTPRGASGIDDPVLGLFELNDTTPVKLAFNDDSPGLGADSKIVFMVPGPGVYFAAVSGFNDYNFDGYSDSGGGAPSTDFSYSLHITTDFAQLPLPGTAALLALALAGLAGLGRSGTAGASQPTPSAGPCRG
jgi:hypothetical protein